MVEVKIIKECDEGSIGEIINYSAPSARDVVELGVGEYVKKKPDSDYKPKVIQSKKNIEKTKEYSFEDLQKDVLQWLAIPRTGQQEATELMCDEFLKRHRVYSIRNDSVQELWIYDEGIYIPEGVSYIQQFCARILEKAYTSLLANKVVDKIKVKTYIAQEDFFNNSPKNIVPVNNGLLNIIEKKLYPFDPNLIFFNKLELDYDETKTCDKILDFFKSILKTEEDIKVIQEWFGFCLLKEYKFEKAMMFVGHGRNGKTKTIELLKRMINPLNCISVNLQAIEGDKFTTIDFMNKMVNIAGDISGDDLKKTNNFKALTGRDYITAPRKFKSSVKFTNYAKMLFSANELPRVFDKSKGFWDRWLMIEFPYRFLPQKEIDYLDKKEKENVKLQDPDIIDKISSKEQLSGLMNWALVGLERLLKLKDFSLKASSDDIKKKWMRKADSFTAFCLDYLEQYEDGKIKKSELRRIYSKYCKVHKIKMLGDKTIKWTLCEEFGADEERWRESNNPDILYWDGVKFKKEFEKSQNGGSAGVFSTYRQKLQNALGPQTRPQNTQDNSTGNSNERFIDVVVDCFNGKECISTGDLISQVAEIMQKSESEVENRLRKLKKNGDIFYPRPGFIQIML